MVNIQRLFLHYRYRVLNNAKKCKYLTYALMLKKKIVKLQDADTGHHQIFGLASTTILTVQQCEELTMMNKTDSAINFMEDFIV